MEALQEREKLYLSTNSFIHFLNFPLPDEDFNRIKLTRLCILSFLTPIRFRGAKIKMIWIKQPDFNAKTIIRDI